MKKLFLLLAMVCCLQASAYVRGDVDGDDKVDVSDLNYIINKILGKGSVESTDVNNDGTTDVGDINIIINIILGKEQDTKEYVDLGLPSGTLWATCNVGATEPIGIGLYFAWGETVGYANGEPHDFDYAHYKWMTPGQADIYYLTKYTFADNMKAGHWYNGDTYVGTTVNGVTYKNLKELLPEDDAATASWGPEWRMPSADEIKELVDERYTYTSWGSFNDVYGRWVISKINNNSIFFPAADYRYFSWPSTHNTNYSKASYPSRTLYDTTRILCLYLSDNKVYYNMGIERFNGFNIRAVRVEKAKR